ncbi:MAG: NAD(P)/FAD-dependent oxidoreductase [Spirochaetales bacterium]|nr:NAD(P)/FAD-dependent oxidoreductase [Spirochaetales bacterium]
MGKKYDVIIIGSGIGGLVTAGMLSKAGFNVLVLEKHSYPGGYCTSFKRKGFIFSPGAHLMGAIGNKNVSLGRLFTRLKVDVDFIRLNPMDHIHFPDRTYFIPGDLESYQDFLIREFPAEKENIKQYLKIFRGSYRYFLRGQLSNPYFNGELKGTFQELLDSFFNDNKLKTILSCQWGYVGLPPAKVSFFSMFLTMGSYIIDGAWLVKGGAQKLSDALVARIRENGSEVKLRCQVKKIVHDDKKVNGVILENNTTVLSDIIISNADLNHTYYDLMDSTKLNHTYLERFKKMRPSLNFFLLFLGVKDFPGIEKIHGWHYKSYNLNLPGNSPLYIYIPTLFDKSLAPGGKQIVQVMTEFPYQFSEIKDWEKCKRELTEKILVKLGKKYPELIPHIEIIESATPMTNKKYTFNTKGAGYGWEKTPDQIFFDFDPEDNVLENFYKVGHWTPWGYGTAGVANSGNYIVSTIIYKSKTT